jgi:hypothetical protein
MQGKRKINTKDISIIVQGAIDPENTPICLKSIRNYLPDATIILSTWKGSCLTGLDYDVLILNDDPGSFDMSPHEKSNVSRQIISTLNGLKKARTKYALKLRSDLELASTSFLNFFSRFNRYDPAWHFLKGRIIIPSMVSRDPRHWESPMCPSDWASFGLLEDMLALWDIPLPSLADQNWFQQNSALPLVKKYYASLFSRYNPEQHIWTSFIRKYRPVLSEHMFDVRPETVAETLKSFANNLIIISLRQFGLKNLKPSRRGSDHWRIITYECFKKMYNEFACGKAFLAPVDLQKISLLKNIPSSFGRLSRKEGLKKYVIKELRFSFPRLSTGFTLTLLKGIIRLSKAIKKLRKRLDNLELWWKLEETKVPLFSLVIPAHSRLALLRETLDSVKQLRFTDFELIVSDDSPRRHDREQIKCWLLELHDKYALNVKYVYSVKNLGQAKNVNQGLNHVRGQFVRILHSDDILHPDILSYESKILTSDSKICAIFHNIINFNNTKITALETTVQSSYAKHSAEFFLKHSLHSHCSIPSAILFKRDLLAGIGKYDPKLKRACDWDFWARIVLYAKQNGLFIIHQQQGYVFYRIHSQSNQNAS